MTTETPHLDLTPENRDKVQREAARAWHRRCKTAGLRVGTKGRQAQLEAYLQGTLACLTAARLMTHDDAARVAFLVAVDRGEDLLQRWADYRTDEEAAADVQARCHGAAAEQLL